MKKNNFLVKLNKEEKLELIEHSNEVSDSYLEKADNCLASAKLLFENKYECSNITSLARSFTFFKSVFFGNIPKAIL